MESMAPPKNIKDEFNIALVVITTIFGSALYILGGITAYKLHSADSVLTIYKDVHRHAHGGPRMAKQGLGRSCCGPLAPIKGIFILFWPFFMAYAMGWGALYVLWLGLNARSQSGSLGMVTKELRAKLEGKTTMPFPRLCRRLMGTDGVGKDGGSARSSTQTAVDLGLKSEDMELGVTIGKHNLSSVDSDLTMAGSDATSRGRATPTAEGDQEHLHREFPTGEQDIGDGVDGIVDIDQKAEGQQLPVFQLQQPSLPDRTSSLRGTPALWTIHETEEADEEDVEIETMGSEPIRPAKKDWSPI